ncbi:MULTISPECIES: hypothetical protein [Pontibacillus]|uniref:Uncharacterized protein n=1 Tax=Pontibacillus chungwhensis TaxID=265426 RepID=A0ABY8V6U7_9BACI|nr:MULTISPECIES: hypothetical protein [Pontibacillus]MCD5326156.1 hypothetical protein [Pontibacillus sp. HN14]WIG00286.1 hypothetical protein QNI29_21000 [Pontibacillus chungwhensis]
MDNRQAAGYMLLACQRAGLSKEKTKELYSTMYFMFDVKTEEEAEEQGLGWYHTSVDDD